MDITPSYQNARLCGIPGIILLVFQAAFCDIMNAGIGCFVEWHEEGFPEDLLSESACEATRKHGFVKAGASTGKQLFHNATTLRPTGGLVLHGVNSVPHFRLAAMSGAGKNKIRARRPTYLEAWESHSFVGRASLPVIFKGGL